LLKNKIKSLGSLKSIISRLKRKGKIIVFTNGCFDLLHYGHVKYLESAKRKGDILIVAINSDSSVRKIKGSRRPVINQKDRARLIAALESVDYALVFSDKTPLKVIKSLKPNILVKGADWNKDNIVGAGFVSSYNGRVSTIEFIKGYSTTNIIKKIAKLF